jgi:hypothetical protein
MTVGGSSHRRAAIIGAGHISTFHLRAIQHVHGLTMVPAEEFLA